MTHTGQKISFDSVFKKVVVENMSPMISSSDEIKKKQQIYLANLVQQGAV